MTADTHPHETARDGRAELSLGGLWFRWSSLGRRDKADVIGMLVLAMAGGAAQALTQDADPGWPRAVAPALILPSLLLFFRFCHRQDELFRRVMLHGAAGAGYGALAAIFGLQAFAHVTGRSGVDAVMPVVLLGMLVGSVVATVRAYRRLV